MDRVQQSPMHTIHLGGGGTHTKLGQQPTGWLVDRSQDDGKFYPGVVLSDARGRQHSLPRSFVTDGSRCLLLLHVALHCLAISFLAIGCDKSRQLLQLEPARILGISAVVSYSTGFCTLLLNATANEFPTDYVVLNTLTVLGLLAGVLGTTVLFALSIRASWEADHYWLSAALCSELCAVSVAIACGINLCARGGRVHTADYALAKNAPRSETAEIKDP